MHTHTILTAAAKSSIKGLFLPPLPPFQAYLMIFKDMSPYHVHANFFSKQLFMTSKNKLISVYVDPYTLLIN